MIPTGEEIANVDGDPSPDVSLVVPGRNAERTLGACLNAAKRLLVAGRLREVLFVDDGSTDGSARLAADIGVGVLSAGGVGPGAARNVGWRRAGGEWVWFIDADCVIEAGTFDKLLGELGEAPVGPPSGAQAPVAQGAVAGVGGSYSNAVPGSLLARLIHAEIRERHASMAGETDYLGSFNVLYRRSVLEDLGGFDESWVNGPGAPGGEDADLSYRIAAAGHRLRFRPDARVGHHHPVSLWGYLRAQRLHGFWGVRLYRRHPGRGRRNAYSGHLDHLQPVLALGVLLSTPLAWLGVISWLPTWLPLLLLGLLVLTTLPMAWRLVRRRGLEMSLFVPLATLRAFARGLGLAWGLADMLSPGQWRPRR